MGKNDVLARVGTNNIKSKAVRRIAIPSLAIQLLQTALQAIQSISDIRVDCIMADQNKPCKTSLFFGRCKYLANAVYAAGLSLTRPDTLSPQPEFKRDPDLSNKDNDTPATETNQQRQANLPEVDPPKWPGSDEAREQDWHPANQQDS